MGVRNLAVEKKAVDNFIQKMGKKPETPQDWGQVHRMAYPTINDLPEDLKDESTMAFYQGTDSQDPAKITGAPIGDIAQQRDKAFGRVQELGQGNEAMRVLQEAIKEKANFKQAPLGESEIFKQAGVGGMGALAASLATRSNEIETNRVDFRNSISEMRGQYKDMAEMALNNYNAITDEYKTQLKRLQDLEDDSREYEQSINVLKLKHEMDKELKRLAPPPNPTEIHDGNKIGYTWENGEWMKMRTDRHNNPTAFTTDIAKQAGLVEGVDYAVGDSFDNNKDGIIDGYTAKLLSDPINTTIKVIDKIGFQTQAGGKRWDYMNMPKAEWDALDFNGKKEVIKKMYSQEGGSGELFGESGALDQLSPTVKMFYEGKYVPKTPSAYDELVNELSAAGLELPMDLEPKSIIQGIRESYNLLTKISDSKRGQIQGRWQEITRGEERDEDIQRFKSTSSMIGMFLARLVEKGRMSDQDRVFYLGQMPNLRQSSNEVARQSTEALIKIVGERFNIQDTSSGTMKLKDPKSGEVREGNWSSEEIDEALNSGYEIVN